MKNQLEQAFYENKTDEELDVLVAEAAGLVYANTSGVGAWLDEFGAIIHLESEFKPTSKMNVALSLFQEIAAEGNGLAINTADVITKKNTMMFGGFDKKEVNPLPLLYFEISDICDFCEFRKTFLRGVSIFYILYKISRESGE